MAYHRRVRVSNITVDENRKAKFTDAGGAAKQNLANSYQQWLIPGVLCTATQFIMRRADGRSEEGIPVTYGCAVYTPFYDSKELAVMKGENIMYLGELYRRRVKDTWAPGGVRVEVAHKFLAPRCGVILSDPTFFQDAFTEDVKDAVTG
jgi:hypothetical protein